jgi:dCMP deaminase
MIINAGIKVIYYLEGYADTLSKDMLLEAGIEVIQLKTS